MRKCDFKKVTWNFFEITLSHWCSPVNLLHIFKTTFIRTPMGTASVALRSSFFMKEALLAQTYFILIRACLSKIKK